MFRYSRPPNAPPKPNIVNVPGTMENHYTGYNNLGSSEATRKLHRQEIP